MRELIERLDDEAAARLCGQLVRRGPDGAPFDAALLALAALLDAGELGYERHCALYAAARNLQDEQLALMLLSADPAPAGIPTPAPLGEREPTLGERKSLARSRNRPLLDRLLRQTDASVLAILLKNPRLTEADAVRVAARRPTSPEAQRAIFGCERFIARYAVKLTLVLNPFTPSDLSARLVGLLNRRDLRAVAHDPTLPETVRRAAQAHLEASRPGVE